MDAVRLAAQAAPPIGALGGAFMLDGATIARGEALGLDLASFYGVGRGAVLGDVDADVVAAAFAFIPREVVRAAMDRARKALSAADALGHYAEANRAWGREHLAQVADAGRLCDLLERVVAAGDVAGNPLFAGWRAVELPQDPPARLAQLLFVAREHRGGPHLAALLAGGLSPLEAVMVSGGGGAAALYGWPEPWPDPEPLRALHAAAVALTDQLVADAYAGFDDAEASELVDRLLEAQRIAGVAGRG